MLHGSVGPNAAVVFIIVRLPSAFLHIGCQSYSMAHDESVKCASTIGTEQQSYQSIGPAYVAALADVSVEIVSV